MVFERTTVGMKAIPFSLSISIYLYADNTFKKIHIKCYQLFKYIVDPILQARFLKAYCIFSDWRQDLDNNVSSKSYHLNSVKSLSNYEVPIETLKNNY